MPRNQNTFKFVILPILIGGLLALAFFSGWLSLRPQALISPTSNFITQYAGQPAYYGSFSWMATHPFPIDFNNIAIIGDYKIVVEKKNVGEKLGEPYCQANTCGGTQTGINADGCPIYEGIKSTSVNHDIGCTCGSTGCGKCNSGTFSFPGQVLSCSAYGAKDSGCSVSGYSIQCGGCLQLQSGGSCGSVNCDVTYKEICGGLVQNVLYKGEGCWSKATIYYKNQKIKETGWDNRRQSFHFLKGQVLTHQEEDLHIDLQSDSQYFSSTVRWVDNEGANREALKGCHSVISDYIFKLPQESFILNISAIQEQVFEGQLVAVNVSIINNYGKEILGKLTVDFEVPTTIGSAKKTEEKMLAIPIGQSDHLFEIPTTQVTDKIYVTPRVDFLMKGSDFQGTNYICYGQTIMKDRALNSCEYVQIGEIKEKMFTVNIIPKPLFIKKPTTGCPIGYSENTGDKSLCLRDDIKELSCFQLGCPIIEGNEYKCTSSGFCAETVFVQKECKLDSDCPSDTKCDSGSGLCIKTEIFREILQCETANDCAVPCQGKTAVCSLNKCEYSGICTPTKIDCRVVGCPETYDCVTSLNQYVCSKETIVKQKCGELGCPEGTTCNIDTGVCSMVVKIDCRTSGCPSGAVCDANSGVCLKSIPVEKCGFLCNIWLSIKGFFSSLFTG